MKTLRRPVALLWSGGKDAVLVLEALREEVVALVTTVLAASETVTMHGVPLALIRAQAEALALPLRVMHLPEGAPNEVYEERLAETLAPLRREGIASVAAGDLLLEDVRAYREALIRRLGFVPLFPLWQQSTAALARRFIARGYQAVVCSVDTDQLDARFAGRRFDAALLRDLPPGTDPCGEHGEFHTFVLDGPLFEQPIGVEVGETFGEGRMRQVCLRLAAAPP